MEKKIQELKNTNFEKGFLYRADDGVKPLTADTLLSEIEQMKIDGDFSGIIDTQGPPYSFSGVFTNAPSFIWYNHLYSEAFPNPKNTPKKQFERTIIGIIPKSDKIIIEGGCAWDADSDLRALGNIPLRDGDKATALSQFADTLPFNGVANFSYTAPTSSNNNSLKNPLIVPRTKNNKAESKKSVENYIEEMGNIKRTYFETMLKQCDGYTDDFSKYIDDNWNLGIESEILVTPKNETAFYKKKFDMDDVLAIAFFQDGNKVEDDPKYINAAKDFLKNVENSWITNKMKLTVNDIPIVLVNDSLLTEVPIDATSATSENSLGQEVNIQGIKGNIKPFNKKKMHVWESNKWKPFSKD